jgi:ribulose-bisphosphate carboxylase large chain
MIEAIYLATRPEMDPTALAEAIAREQSLEILPALIPKAIGDRLLGRVLSVTRRSDDVWEIRIAYPEVLASLQLSQLIQLLYGNVSFYPRVRLIDFTLPATLSAAFQGPADGIRGLRHRLGVYRRALLLTVLKPRGSTAEHLAGLAERFVRGGGDLLKDDQNLIDLSFEAFVHRVSACADAVDRAGEATGRNCLYLPVVSGAGGALHRRLEWVARRGLPGVVLCPWIIGLEHAAAAAREYGLIWLAHPAGAGSHTQPTDHGVAPELIFGRLPRLAGADLTIFPGAGGRISLGAGTRGPDRAIAEALRSPWHAIRPSLPCTGGGKTIAQLPETVDELGVDCAIVVGGDLLRAGAEMTAATRRAIEQLEDLSSA